MSHLRARASARTSVALLLALCSPSISASPPASPLLPTDVLVLLESPADPIWLHRTTKILKGLKDRRLRRTISLNLERESAGLHIILFDSRKARQPSEYDANCRYRSASQVIVCDIELFRHVLELYDFHEAEETTTNDEGHIVQRHIVPASEAKVAEKAMIFMRWILLHEVGHHASDHQGEFLYLRDATADSETDAFHVGGPSVLAPKNTCHELELTADRFLLSSASSKWLNSVFYVFLVDLVNREIIRSACPSTSLATACDNIYPGVGLVGYDDHVMVEASRTHPAVLVRVLELIGSIRDDAFTEHVKRFAQRALTDRSRFYPPDSECRKIVQRQPLD